MGIKDLTKFLKDNAPESINFVSLGELQNKKVAIDISIFLYKFKYKNKNIIQKFLEQIHRLKLNNITPIYIFDGPPPKEKFKTIIERKEKMEDNIKKKESIKEELTKLINANNSINNDRINYLKKELDKFEDKLIKITKEDISSVKYFFDVLNIKYIQAKGEADILCSKLCTQNICQMVMSEDMDILTSGTPLLLREFNCNNNKIYSYNLNIILDRLNLSYEKWVEFCILCGCDYVKRIYGLGPKFSYKLIKDNTIEEVLNIIKSRDKITIPDNYLDKFYKAKNIFMINELELELENNLNLDKETKLFDNELQNIKLYLTKNTSLSNKQIDNRIKNIYK